MAARRTSMVEGMPPWVEGFPGAVTVIGADGTILYLNDKASEAFAGRGGREALLGKDIMACHGETSRATISALLREGRANSYTIEKGGKRKLIYQAPWFQGGEIAGLVELSLIIPSELPHFVRNP
jgi:hypothetical protein